MLSLPSSYIPTTTPSTLHSRTQRRSLLTANTFGSFPWELLCYLCWLMHYEKTAWKGKRVNAFSSNKWHKKVVHEYSSILSSQLRLIWHMGSVISHKPQQNVITVFLSSNQLVSDLHICFLSKFDIVIS